MSHLTERLSRLRTWYRQRRFRTLYKESKKNCRQQLTTFERLPLTEGVKKPLRRRIRHFSIQLSAAKLWRDRLETPIYMLLVLLFLVAVFNIPSYMVGEVIKPKFAVSAFKNFGLISFFSITTGLFFLLLPNIFGAFYSKLGRRFIAHSIITAIWFLLGFVLSSAYAYYLLFVLPREAATIFEQLALLGSLGVICFLATGMLTLYASDFVESRFDHRLKLVFPSAAVESELMEILGTMTTKAGKWPESEFRKGLLAKVNRIALCIERYLYLSQVTDDLIVNARIKETCGRIAAEFRVLALSVLFIEKGTEESFRKYTTKCLLYVLEGEWGLMTQRKPPQVSRPKKLGTRALSILVGLLSAAIPFVGLVILRRSNIVDAQLTGYLGAAAFAWAALSIISQIDPDYGNKLSALEKLRQLSISGKGKE